MQQQRRIVARDYRNRRIGDTEYFDTEKLAIEVYKHFIAIYGFTPKPIVLEKALGFYTAKKKGIRLAKQTPKDGHTVFVKVIPSSPKQYKFRYPPTIDIIPFGHAKLNSTISCRLNGLRPTRHSNIEE